MSRFCLFVDGSEWLNDTMRLNGAFWMAIDNISKRSYSCAIAVWCVCKNTRAIWEIPVKNLFPNHVEPDTIGVPRRTGATGNGNLIYKKEEAVMSLVLVPILDGKLDAWKQWAADLNGSDELKDLNSRYGLTKHEAWLAMTPAGPFIVAIHEGPGSDDFMHKLASSDHEADVRFREKLLELHGMDITKPPPGTMPERIIGG